MSKLIMSESIANISVALNNAQKEIKTVKKETQAYNYKYADLTAVLDAIKDVLNSNNITILQPHTTDENGNAVVQTVLLHVTGEYIGGNTLVVCAKENDPQAFGSALTYARRYGLQSLVSLPSEDDDAASAMPSKGPARRTPTKKTETPEASTESNISSLTGRKKSSSFGRN